MSNRSRTLAEPFEGSSEELPEEDKCMHCAGTGLAPHARREAKRRQRLEELAKLLAHLREMSPGDQVRRAAQRLGCSKQTVYRLRSEIEQDSHELRDGEKNDA
jgi:hypothetical protein